LLVAKGWWLLDLSGQLASGSPTAEQLPVNESFGH
jgi:hypothetical protein